MVQGLVRLMLLAAMLAGCATTPTTGTGGGYGSSSSSSSSMPSGEPRQQPVDARADLQGSPALALLDRAEGARNQGNMSAAGRYLERALNMEPDSSWVYRQLARLRLEEGDAHSAEGLALRALRLAPYNPGYQAELWELVATARERQGDEEGARDARKRAQELRRGTA
ncbi:tetratricopeptide repeat protein [Alloalcanivorax balearicus]|nr:tetratricopeptide repeat protein [Alloalcanivorax balearicus]